MKIGSKIKELREAAGLSRRQLSEEIDEAEAKIQKIEIDKQRADHIFLAKVAKYLKADANDLLGNLNNLDRPNPDLEGSPIAASDFIKIKRYAVSVSAGHGAQIEEDELGTGWYAFNKTWLDKRNLKPNHLSVISVRGDSMEPKFSDKDLVLLDHSQNLPEDGFIYAINYDNALYIKAIQRAPHDTLNLVSENKSYPPISINLAKDADSLRVVGRVVASMHEW